MESEKRSGADVGALENEASDAELQVPDKLTGIRDALTGALGIMTRQADVNSGRLDEASRPNQPTGFRSIDALAHGLWPGELTLVAGAPGSGKTSFATGVAVNAALQGSKVLLFSPAADGAATALRMCAAHDRVPIKNLATGRLTEGDWCSFTDAANELSETDLSVCDDAGLTAEDMRASALEASGYAPGKRMLVVLDGAELLKPPDAIQLKRLAREVGAPVLATVTCPAEKLVPGADAPERKLRALPPGFAAAADSVLYISKSEAREADVVVAKHQICAPQSVKLAFVPECLRFEDSAGDPQPRSSATKSRLMDTDAFPYL